jgi:hypothetical protein
LRHRATECQIRAEEVEVGIDDGYESDLVTVAERRSAWGERVDEMGPRVELKDYWLAVRHRWRIIVLIVTLSVGAAALLTWQATPQYSSTVSIFVSTSPSDTADAYQDNLFATQRPSRSPTTSARAWTPRHSRRRCRRPSTPTP